MSALDEMLSRIGLRRRSRSAYEEMCAARRAFLSAWTAWIDEAKPTREQVNQELNGTSSALRQLEAIQRMEGSRHA